MPTTDQIAGIYDFPGILEPALANFFRTLPTPVTSFTTNAVPTTGDETQDDLLVEQGFEILTFQKDIPRIEIVFTPGAGQQIWQSQTIASQVTAVEASWDGAFDIDCLTRADIRIHKGFLTLVRYVMHTQLQSLNGNQLTQHNIAPFIRDEGTSLIMRPQDGIFQSRIRFGVNVSIQNDAWQTLSQ